MATDPSLQNKYDRLCVEFNKLRRKHSECKAIVVKHAEQLETLRKQKDERIAELENKCKELGAKSGTLCESQREHSQKSVTTPEHNGMSTGTPCAGNERFSCSSHENIGSPTYHSRSAQCSDTVIERLISELQKWTSAIDSASESKAKPSAEQSFLIKRVEELERELCDVSVELQLERKRRVCKDNESQSAELSSSSSTCYSERDKLMIDFLRKRNEINIERAQQFSAVAQFLRDELRSIVPHLTNLARELQEAQAEVHSSRNTIRQLDAELDCTKRNTLNQNNELAQHVAQLTEELQNLRRFSPNTAPNKKNPLLNVLKR